MILARYALLVLMVAAAPPALAGINVELANGINHTRGTRLYLFGLTTDAGTLFGVPSYREFNLGAWHDHTDDWLAGIAQGLQWDFEHVGLRVSLGGSFVSETNARLSTRLEFYEQLALMAHLPRVDVILSARHWSNGGVKQPNGGMDFVGLSVEYPW